ncbi:MAG: methionyl-tRNA formyltransferase [Lentisphaeria bacterium]|nr:methionyl-tRNA formyltransferase [Lentisphaeria bacterium]
MKNPCPARVYYLASGMLGVPVMDALLADKRIQLVGAGTQPDRPAGRKRQPVPSPVGQHAAQLGLPLDKPESVNTEEFLEHLRALAPDLVLVASFGQILKKPLLALPAAGCLNVHASLLPRHRGAAPINAAILEGDEATGVSFMEMEAGLDTGPVYSTVPTRIDENETAAELEAKLGILAAEHVVDCILGVACGRLKATPQSKTGATYVGKLRKEDGLLNWTLPAVTLARRVRGLQPWPKTHTFIPSAKGMRRVQITQVRIPAPGDNSDAKPGEVVRADRSAWLVACGEGTLEIRRAAPEGRREMDAQEFLRGFPLKVGCILGGPLP